MPWFEKLHNNGKPTGQPTRFFTEKEAAQLLKMKSAKWRRCEDDRPMKSRTDKTPVEKLKKVETLDTWVERVHELGLTELKAEIKNGTKEQLEALKKIEKRKSALEAIEVAFEALIKNK